MSSGLVIKGCCHLYFSSNWTPFLLLQCIFLSRLILEVNYKIFMLDSLHCKYTCIYFTRKYSSCICCGLRFTDPNYYFQKTDVQRHCSHLVAPMTKKAFHRSKIFFSYKGCTILLQFSGLSNSRKSLLTQVLTLLFDLLLFFIPIKRSEMKEHGDFTTTVDCFQETCNSLGWWKIVMICWKYFLFQHSFFVPTLIKEVNSV